MAVPQGRASLTYVPGSWVGVAGPDVVLLAECDAAAPIVTAFWDAADAGAGVDALLGVIVREGLRSVPSFAIAGRSGDGLRVLVSGKARAEVAGGAGPTVLDAADAPTWLDRTLPGADTASLVAAGGEPAGRGPVLALHGGVVLAAAVTLTTTAGASSSPPPAPVLPAATAQTQVERPSPPPEPAPTPAAATAESPAVQAPSNDTMQPRPQDAPGVIDSLPWLLPAGGLPPAPPTTPAAAEPPPPAAAPPPTTPAAPPTQQHAVPGPPAGPPVAGHHTMDRTVLPKPDRAAPTVLAVVCPNRHLGPPYAGICRVCGAQIPHQDPFSTPRPVLGVLNISTGAMVPLDRDVVLGRAPSANDAEPQTRPHLVQLASPDNDISRNHVRVSLEGWHVLVTDLGSTNGTAVTLPGQQPVRLRAHDAFTIVPGTIVNLADEVNVRFEVPA